MSVVKNILEKLSGIQKYLEGAQVQLEAAQLESGHTVECEKFEVGEQIMVMTSEGEQMALPEGSYALDNGLKISVDENGILTAVEPITKEPAAEAPAAPEVEASAEPQAKKVVETQATTKETFFSREDIEAIVAAKIEATQVVLKEQNENLKTELAALKTQLEAMPADKPISRAPKIEKPEPFYANPKTAAERLLNIQSQIKQLN